jgi:MFS family permease
VTVGDRLGQVALAVLALDLTDSALIVGITVSARHVPLLVLSRAGGQIIDRARNKASLIAATQAASAGLTIAFYALVSAGHATATAVVSFALVSGVCNVVDLPARWALVGELVGERHIARATSLATTAMAVGRACGPALASAIIAFGSISVVFAANSVTFALTAVIFAALAPRLAQAGHAEHAPVSIPARRGGIAGGLRSPALGPALALTLAVTVFALNTEAVLIVFVRDSFVRESYYGPLLAAMGVGAICGALGAGWWRTPRVAGLAALAASLGGALLVMGLATTIVAAGAVYVMGGTAGGAFVAASSTFLQLAASPERRGEVMAMYMAVLTGAGPIGAPLAGFLADQLGPRGAFGTLGALLVTSAAVAATRDEPAPTHPG